MNLSHLFKFLLIFSIFFTGCEENFPYEDILDLSGAVSEELPEGEDLNGYEAVDLGLPSGIKWATCNVGATRPGDYGKRYAWGEIKEKDYYNWDIYKWAKGSSTTLTKYCTDSSNGTVDGKKYLDLEDDVAHAAWGGSWRMPTAAEFEELRNECSWYWTSENGNNGYRVTSRTNGNSIFLPTGLYSSGSPYDYYWSSSKGSSDSYARCLYIYKSSASITIASRYINYPIRPVSGDRIKFSVSVNSAGNGTVAIKGDSLTSAAFKEASAVTVTATPDSGFEFKGWFVGDADAPVSADAEYTFTVYENVALVAKFVKPATVTVSSAGNGAVAIKDVDGTSATIEVGSTVTVVATPDEGYAFSGWFIDSNETPVSTAAEYTFTVSEDVALEAKFTKCPVVTISSGGNGSVSFADSSNGSKVVLPGTEVTVVATPAEGYMFSGWYANGNETPVSTAAEYTFTVSEDVTLTARFEQMVNYNGYEYVDLGLPSGIKWATCNVGATNPEEYGGYYAWGETEEKKNYDESTYKWRNGSSTSSYGTVDNKTVLDPEDDVAHVKWGGSWRMPTKAEQDELRNNCTWTWTTQNGVNGYKVTSKTNGNSIFLPAAGGRNGANLNYSGSVGYYWSSSLNEGYSYSAFNLYFYSGLYDWFDNLRYNGFSVRPVSE